MRTHQRLLRFYGVSVLGMGLQLAALACLNRVVPGHILWTSAASVELAILHNFAWHQSVTWPHTHLSTLTTLLRFHASNGAVSLLGNLFLMRLLVHGVHLPVMLANLFAIAACSVANFTLANFWAFACPAPPTKGHPSNPLKSIPLLIVFGAYLPGLAPAQAQPPTPAPKAYFPPASVSNLSRAGVLCGVGVTSSPLAAKPTTGCGAGITLFPGVAFVEVGVMGPQANRSYLSGYVSVDTSIPLAKPSSKYLPMILFGYSRLFETGHALDYGLALGMPRWTKRGDSADSLRIELRDYWTFANPTQHNVMLRIGRMILRLIENSKRNPEGSNSRRGGQKLRPGQQPELE